MHYIQTGREGKWHTKKSVQNKKREKHRRYRTNRNPTLQNGMYKCIYNK